MTRVSLEQSDAPWTASTAFLTLTGFSRVPGSRSPVAAWRRSWNARAPRSSASSRTCACTSTPPSSTTASVTAIVTTRTRGRCTSFRVCGSTPPSCMPCCRCNNCLPTFSPASWTFTLNRCRSASTRCSRSSTRGPRGSPDAFASYRWVPAMSGPASRSWRARSPSASGSCCGTSIAATGRPASGRSPRSGSIITATTGTWTHGVICAGTFAPSHWTRSPRRGRRMHSRRRCLRPRMCSTRLAGSATMPRATAVKKAASPCSTSSPAWATTSRCSVAR